MIEHYQYIEGMLTSKQLSELGTCLYVMNVRGHGDYEDNLRYIYGRFSQDRKAKKEGFYWFQTVDHRGNLTLEKVDTDLETSVVGYMIIDKCPVEGNGE